MRYHTRGTVKKIRIQVLFRVEKELDQKVFEDVVTVFIPDSGIMTLNNYAASRVMDETGPVPLLIDDITITEEVIVTNVVPLY